MYNPGKPESSRGLWKQVQRPKLVSEAQKKDLGSRTTEAPGSLKKLQKLWTGLYLGVSLGFWALMGL